jgi:dienelactone hydrolase
MPSRRDLLVAGLIASALRAVPGATAADVSPALMLSLGPHAVGFRVVNHRDAERRLADGALRPVQVSLWYPAAAATATPAMRYRDYVAVAARERTLDALDARQEADSLAAYRAFLRGNGLSDPAIDAWLDAGMLASREVAAERGRFPIVLIAPGSGGAVQDEAALGEALASHGYVVAVTPSPLRLGARMESEADVPVVAAEQARDLEIALALTAQRSSADPARAAVVGYSFGARPALLLASRRAEIRALVSLDGGIGSRAAKDWLPAAALDRRAFRTPLLHVFEETDEASVPDFTLIASLSAAPRTLVKVAGLRHLDFITFGLAAASLPALGAPQPERLGTGLRAAFMFTQAFLDAYVRDERAAWESLVSSARAPGGELPSGILQVIPFGDRERAPVR